MKAWTAWVLVLILMGSVIGCAPKAEESAARTEATTRFIWGITLEAREATPGGLILECHQAGGEEVAELNTGSYFVIQRREGADWVEMPYIQQQLEIAWTSEAWVVRKDGTTTWEIKWGGLYGELSAGEYRIGKEFMNFRGPGDFDREMRYAEFTVA